MCEELLINNEIEKKIKIDCVTIKDKKAKKYFSKYPSVCFHELNFCSNNFLNYLLSGINYMSRKICGYNFRKRIIENQYRKNILSNEYDLIIFEGVNPYITEKLTNEVGKNKMILHLHRTTEATKEMSDIFGYFIGISNYVSDTFCKNGIVSSQRTFTVLNGINLEKFEFKVNNKVKNNLKEKYGIKEDEIVFIYTGRLLEEKGVKELISAFKMLEMKNKCKLLIIGSAVSGSSKHTTYSKELTEISNGENIIFTGYIPNNELYKFYSVADIAVFPTISEEGFGLVVVEAMSMGLPVIVTNSGGMKEIVTDKCGLKVDIDKNLIKNLTANMTILAQDKELRKHMGDEGYKEAQKYSDKNYYNDFVCTLEKIIDLNQKQND